MTLPRLSKLGVLMLGVAATGFALPANAGFEFVGASRPAPERQIPAEDLAAPMPIVPMAEVTAIPLAPNDQVLKLPAGHAQQPVDPVYVRRQQDAVIRAPKGQPMDTEALLKATEEMQPLSIQGAPRRNQAAAQAVATDGKLVINPFPLESASGANHGGGLGRLATEQAMMEKSGALRAVSVPGKTSPGMIERAKISSRHDKGSQYLDRTSVTDDAAMMGLTASITPIPGGEGAPLTAVSTAPLAAAPVPAPVMPRPATPEGHPQPTAAVQPAPKSPNDFPEAVGFGRDLPLALALSQVVPAEYGYAFGPAVDVGSTVSWHGGKPWNLVLDDMLATQGLRAVISGTQITIISTNQPA